MTVEKYEATPTLEEFNLNYFRDATLVRRHVWHQTIYKKINWALVLACYQNRIRGYWNPPQYRLVRFRWAGGLWHARNHFNLGAHHLGGLAAATAEAIRRESELDLELVCVNSTPT